MHRFIVVLQDQAVGTTDLEYLDEGMGVGHGRFHPLPPYDGVRDQVIHAAEARHSGKLAHVASPPFELRSSAGEHIATSFVVVEDFPEASAEFDLEIAAQFRDAEQYVRVTGEGGLTSR